MFQESLFIPSSSSSSSSFSSLGDWTDDTDDGVELWEGKHSFLPNHEIDEISCEK